MKWLRIASLVCSVSALILLVMFLRKDGSSGNATSGSVAPAPVVERLPALYGAFGDLRCALLPLAIDPAVESFQIRQWNQFLGREARPLTYVQCLVENVGDVPWTLPAEGPAALENPADPSWKARSLQDLLAEAREVPPYVEKLVESRSPRGAVVLPAGRRITYVVALPPRPEFETLQGLVWPALGNLRLRPAHVARTALEDLLAGKGKGLGAVVVYDDSTDDIKGSADHDTDGR